MVLLHVVEAPWPIDLSLDDLGRQRLRQRVPDDAILDLYIKHRHIVERTGIGRLPTTLGIERTLVEREGRTARTIGARDHTSAKMGQVRIGIIETFGDHRITRIA